MSTPLRYVILHHEGIPDPHFDLMFEREAGGTLITFRSRAWPLVERTVIEPSGDHRRAYLEYEGAVSGNRGRVRRVEAGTYEPQPAAPSVLHLVLLTPTRVRLRITTEPDAVVCSIEPSV
jgi:hypothetical protein